MESARAAAGITKTSFVTDDREMGAMGLADVPGVIDVGATVTISATEL